jgi:hypothetical protein
MYARFDNSGSPNRKALAERSFGAELLLAAYQAHSQ